MACGDRTTPVSHQEVKSISTIERARTLARRVPMAGNLTFGQWLDSLPLTIIFFHGQDGDFSYADGHTLHLRDNDLDRPEFSQIYSPSGSGLANVTAWLLHEARHSTPGGGVLHRAGPYQNAITMDGSLRDKGAWWIEYQWYRALARMPWLSGRDRAFALSDAQWVLRNIADMDGAFPVAVGKLPHHSPAFCSTGGYGLPFCVLPFCGTSAEPHAKIVRP